MIRRMPGFCIANNKDAHYDGDSAHTLRQIAQISGAVNFLRFMRALRAFIYTPR